MSGKKVSKSSKPAISQVYLKLLLENTLKSFILLDKDYKILMFNKMADRGMRFFYSKPIVHHTSYWDYVDKESNASFIKHFEKALKGKKITTERSLTSPAGNKIWIEASYIPAIDDEQNIYGVLYSYLNITDRKESEQALKESETNLRAVFNSSRDSYLLIDSSYRLIAMNPTAKKSFPLLFEMPVNIGDNLTEMISGDLKNRFKRNMKIALTGGFVTSSGTKEINRKNLHYELDYSPVKNEDGKIYGVTIVGSNVTEKKRAELDLVKSENNLKSIFNNTSQLFFLLDKYLKIVAFNKAGADMIRLQFNTEVAIGDNILSYVQENSRQSTEDEIREAFSGKTILKEYHNFFTKKDWWFERNYNPVYNKNREITGVTLWSNNITERKKAEQEIKLNEKKFRTLTTLAPVGIYQHDSNGNLLYVNEKLLLVLNINHDEAYGGMAYKNVHPDEKNKVRKTWETSSKNRIDFYMEYRVISEDGKVTFVVEQAVPLKSNDDVFLGYLGTVTDITEQKQKAQLIAEKELAEKSLKFKSEFLAGMSHEIRTPLNGILSMSELLLDTKLNQQQHEFADNIFSSSKNLRSIVNDILDLSKLEAGKMQLSPSAFDFSAFLDEIKSTYKLIATQKKLSFKVKVENDIPETIITDRRRMMQIITNLLRNAIKFTEKGSIILKAEATEQRGSAVKLKFSVIDTGLGIDKKDQKKLFLDFSQIENKLTNEVEGTGLGLSISKKLVHILGGEIGVESDKGKGSTFWFDVIADSVRVSAKEKNNTQETRFKCTVLLVEDNLINQKAFSMMLKKLGCAVDLVSNGREAIESAANKKYDIIFMDIQMPEMDGFEAAAGIRKNNKKAPPVIALSGNVVDMNSDLPEVKNMDDYLLKPIVSNDLVNMLSKWVKK